MKVFVDLLPNLMTGSHAATFWLLVKKMGSNNECTLSLAEIAHALGLSETAARSAMAELRERGLAAKRRGGVYMVNPEIVVSGSDEKRRVLSKIFKELSAKSMAGGRRTRALRAIVGNESRVAS